MSAVATLPASWYSDPAVLRLEEERIFRRAWQYVGHADEVAAPSSYVAVRAGDVPVVVVRDADGELRAFVNVCRHRFHEVAAGSGRRAALQCPYHAWTYGLDGSLRSAPRAEREAAFDPSELSLVPVALDAWGPFLFVNPDAGAAPLAETLGALPERLASAHVDVTALRFHSRAVFELETNWKVACENYLECYHCPVAHPDFSALVDVSPDAYRLERQATFSSQYGPLRDGGDDAAGEVRGAQFHFLWPSLKLNVYPGLPNLSIGPVVPAGAERSTGFLDYFFAPDADDEWIAELKAFDDQVGREDAALVASVQRGLRSGLVERGGLLPESEALVHDFQTRVASALAGAGGLTPA